MGGYRTIGSSMGPDFRNDLNKNFVDIDNDIKVVKKNLGNDIDAIQKQVDEIVVEGDSSVEAAQARVDANGNSHSTLKGRLDEEHTYVTQRLVESDVIIERLSDQIYPFYANVPDEDSKSAFISAMNTKAQEIGMVDTNYANAHGLGASNQVSTVKDTVLLGIHATGYNDLVKVWGKKKYTFDIKGANKRTITIDTSITGLSLEDNYYIFGGKTGTLSGAAGQHTKNLLALVNSSDNNWFVGSVFDAPNDRYAAAKELFDVASLSMRENQETKRGRNLIVNGDFSDGLNNWEVSAGNPLITTEDYFIKPQSLRVDSNGVSSQVKKTISLPANRKYYISVMVNCTRYVKGRLGFQLSTGSNITEGVASTTDGYERVSYLLETSAPTTGTLYVGGISSADLDGYVDDVRIVDLTTQFGAGNEPSKEEADKFIWGDIQALMGAVCLMPIQNPFAYGQDNVPMLFVKNESVIGYPASLTKIMTAIVALDNIQDMNTKIEIASSDITGGSGPTFHKGDIITLKDALYCLMLPSSNTVATALSRLVGKKIFIDKK